MQEGDLLNITSGVIVQQLNCVTVRAHGLSASIAKKFPYANVYAERRPVSHPDFILGKNRCIADDESNVGTCCISRPPLGFGVTVVGLFGQHAPGRDMGRWTQRETPAMRQGWFTRALDHMHNKLSQDVPIYFPWMIGCGLAGGDWTVYRKIIEDFATSSGRNIILVKLPE